MNKQTILSKCSTCTNETTVTLTNYKLTILYHHELHLCTVQPLSFNNDTTILVFCIGTFNICGSGILNYLQVI